MCIRDREISLPDSLYLSLLLAFHFFWVIQNAVCSVLRFSVDNSSGRVTTASSGSSYDRETTPEYFLTIMATDGGGATNTTRVHVTLDDVNDQHPVFLHPEYRAFLKENSNNFDVGVTAQVGAFYFYTYFCTLRTDASVVMRKLHTTTARGVSLVLVLESGVRRMQMRSCAIDFWSKAHPQTLFPLALFSCCFFLYPWKQFCCETCHFTWLPINVWNIH